MHSAHEACSVREVYAIVCPVYDEDAITFSVAYIISSLLRPCVLLLSSRSQYLANYGCLLLRWHIGNARSIRSACFCHLSIIIHFVVYKTDDSPGFFKSIGFCNFLISYVSTAARDCDGLTSKSVWQSAQLSVTVTRWHYIGTYVKMTHATIMLSSQ